MLKKDLEAELAQLRAENAALRTVAADFHYMARRYADGRQSYAVGLFNEHTRTLFDLGVELTPGGEGTIWARDRGGRAYDGLSDKEAAMGEKAPVWTLGATNETMALRALVRDLGRHLRDLSGGEGAFSRSFAAQVERALAAPPERIEVWLGWRMGRERILVGAYINRAAAQSRLERLHGADAARVRWEEKTPNLVVGSVRNSGRCYAEKIEVEL